MVKKAKVKKRSVVKKNRPLTIEQFSSLYDDTFKNEGAKLAFTPSTPLTLCGQLEDAILLLENRISNSIAKINSLM